MWGVSGGREVAYLLGGLLLVLQGPSRGGGGGGGSSAAGSPRQDMKREGGGRSHKAVSVASDMKRPGEAAHRGGLGGNACWQCAVLCASSSSMRSFSSFFS